MNRDYRPQYVPDAITFLEKHFGLRCSIEDADGEDLAIEVSDISAADLRAVLRTYRDAILTRFHVQRRRALTIFVGGPENGKHHGHYGEGCVLPIHCGRAKWAAYRIGDDGLRAWFCGYATSRAKARRLAGCREKRPRRGTEN
jgi:hypothetical protein